jgi:hypothetical protein
MLQSIEMSLSVSAISFFLLSILFNDVAFPPPPPQETGPKIQRKKKMKKKIENESGMVIDRCRLWTTLTWNSDITN